METYPGHLFNRRYMRSSQGLRHEAPRRLCRRPLRACDCIRVTTISGNPFGATARFSDDEALALYREKAAKPSPFKGGYVSEGGNFHSYGEDGLPVLAAIPGVDHYNKPGVHLIYKLGEDTTNSYAESAATVAEFCDEAIMLIERDGSCSLSWSG